MVSVVVVENGIYFLVRAIGIRRTRIGMSTTTVYYSSAWKKSLLLSALRFIAGSGWWTLAFNQHHHVDMLPRDKSKGNENRYHRHRRITLISSTTEEEASTKTITIQQQQCRGGPSSSGACYYKRIDGSWKPRKELNRLFVGERLFAIRLLERCVTLHCFIKSMVRTHVVYSNSFFFI